MGRNMPPLLRERNYFLLPLLDDGAEPPAELLPWPVRVEIVCSIAPLRVFSAVSTIALAAFSTEFAIRASFLKQAFACSIIMVYRSKDCVQIEKTEYVFLL